MLADEGKNREAPPPQTTLQQQPASFAQVLIVLASVIVVLIGIRLAAGPILNTILFALVLALIINPAYGWLQRRLPTLLALLIMVVGLGALSFGLVALLSTSISRFIAELGLYSAEWGDEIAQLQAWLDGLGLLEINLFSVFDPGAIATALGIIATAILSFLSNLFLIVVLILFFLAEGPAMMRRLQASVGEDNPRIERLFTLGKGVSRQFTLRSVVNLATATGITLLLLVVGVNHPLLWGVLSFFLSYVPYIGLVVAVIPPTLLALAESGLGWAALVVVGVLLINVLAEYLLSPYLMSRGLNLSPTVVFLSFIFWIFLLGAPGAFLAMPLTLFLVIMFSTFPEASWLASLMIVQEPASTEEVPTAEAGDSTE